MRKRLLDIYARLEKAFGPQNWWPAESPWEVMVGAVLVQNTSWRNVELAIASLRRAGLLHPAALDGVDDDELAGYLRSAGTYRVKARRLRNLRQLVKEEYSGTVEALLAAPGGRLRSQLLEVGGIGPETADSIVLYAAHQPSFVVDTYTYRVLARHGWIALDADYDTMKAFFESSLPRDADLYGELHALFVQLGKSYCRKSPECEECPLRELLPENGHPCELS